MKTSLALGLTLGAAAFSGATLLDGVRNPVEVENDGGRMVLSGLRSVLAAQFATKADLYFHNGYRGEEREHERGGPVDHGGHEDHDDHDDHDKPGHEGHDSNLAAKPLETDWIDRFGRNFYVSGHSHMDAAQDGRELLPWFALAAKANPNHIDTFISGAFWLRSGLKKPKEAADFLRDGLRHNPRSVPLLVELGRTLQEGLEDRVRAENVFRAALAGWEVSVARNEEPDKLLLESILAHLAELAESRGDKKEAISLLQRLQPLSPNPAAISKRIAELEGAGAK